MSRAKRLNRRRQRLRLAGAVVAILATLTGVGYAAVSSQPAVYACFGDTDGRAHSGMTEYAQQCGPSAHLKRIAADDVVTSTTSTTSTTRPTATTTTRPAGSPGVCPTARPASTYPGPVLTVNQAIQTAYNGGFHSVSTLRIVVGIGAAESSLDTHARRWHPEYGCRPASDPIGVQGPASAWDSTHVRQMSSDRGWLQWSTHWHGEVTDAQADDPLIAAQRMFVVSQSGTTFAEWNTYTDGSWSGHAPSAATVCAAVPATGC